MSANECVWWNQQSNDALLSLTPPSTLPAFFEYAFSTVGYS